MARKICMLLLVLLSGYVSCAQSFGATALDAKGTYDPMKPEYNVWLKSGKTKDVTMKFNVSPVGLNQAMETIERMLVDNQRSYDDPDFMDNIEGTDIGKSKDPEGLHNSIRNGNSRVNMAWNAPDGSTLQLVLNRHGYQINVLNAYK